MARSQLTTLCYIRRGDQYLMLHRTSRQDDVNKDKWIGVGGHFEPGESPEECLVREVREETGYTLTDYQLRGVITFDSGSGISEYMFLYTSDGFTGEPTACSEGKLEWVNREDILKLNLWMGDLVFFRLLAEDAPFFSLKLVYNGGDVLRQAVLNGQPLELLDIVDENGEPTGLVTERGAAHRYGLMHRTVHMWIVRRTGKGYDLLLQKRSLCKDSNPGRYDISSAGHIGAGQEPLPSALREIGEELGIAAQPSDLTFIGTHRVDEHGIFHGKPFNDLEISSVYLYTRPLDISELHLQQSEVESVRWMDAKLLRTAVENNSIPNCIYTDELDMIEKAMKDI